MLQEYSDHGWYGSVALGQVNDVREVSNNMKKEHEQTFGIMITVLFSIAVLIGNHSLHGN